MLLLLRLRSQLLLLLLLLLCAIAITARESSYRCIAGKATSCGIVPGSAGFK
jgi:hypothetical protein